jgi:hypothetical protein
MTSHRNSLQQISQHYETWTTKALSGAPVSFADLISGIASPEAEIRKLKGSESELSLFFAAALGGFRSLDTHLRAGSKGGPQSVLFRRVDIWGRLKAFEVLAEEFSDGLFGEISSKDEQTRISAALVREVRDINDLMMSELALKGELTRVAPFLQWIGERATKLNTSDEVLKLLAAG